MSKPAHDDGRLRLPEDFEDTLGALLAVPPEKEKPPTKKAAAPKKRAKRRSS
jgi:hypothetical protein